MTHQPFGEWLRYHLEHLGMTPAQLARESGLSRGQICEFLSGTHSATMRSAKVIAGVLQATLLPGYKAWHRWNPRPRS